MPELRMHPEQGADPHRELDPRDRAGGRTRPRDRTGQTRLGQAATMEDVRRPATRERSRPIVQRQSRRRALGPCILHGTERPRDPKGGRLRLGDLHGRNHRDRGTAVRPADVSLRRQEGHQHEGGPRTPARPPELRDHRGGVSGLEIGMFYAKLGSRVVVIEIMEQLLPGTDPEAVRVVARNLQKLGVEVHIKSQARGWREDKGQTVVDIVTPEGLIARRADIILVTVGRRPNTDELHAEVAGVELGPRRHVKVDRQLRTSNPPAFPAGGVLAPPFLAHKATKEGLTAAEVIAGHPVELDVHAMPAAIFTDPEIATVGLQEAEANAQGRRTRMGRVPFAAIGRALTTGEYDGFVKLIADADTKVLLGATIVGPNASDLISELTLAIEMGATLADIALTVHPHPTLPEAVMESAEAALGQAIHVLNR